MKAVSSLLLFLIFMGACAHREERKVAEKEQQKSWTEATKAKIIRDANATVDSTHTERVSNSVKEVTFYSKGIRTKRFGIATPSLDTIAAFFYSRDQKFTWVREMCPGVSRSFEGIRYRGKPYGLAAFRYCDGKLKKQGYRFRKNIGVWREWDEQGNLVDSVDYGNAEKLDSLKYIRYKD